MSKFGKRCIASLQEFLRDAKAGKPMRQDIIRRMKVKGKTVYVRDSFTAPIRPQGERAAEKKEGM